MNDDVGERVERLEARVLDLESELARLRAAEAAAPAPTLREHASGLPPPAGPPAVPPAPPWARPSQLPPPPAPARPTASGADHDRLELDSEALLKWGGVGLVVMAVGFAASTAIRRGWIGPELQLLGALLVAVALIVTGLRLSPTRPAWTHALCSGGVAALFTTFASDLFLDQTSTDVGFICIAVAATVGLGLARLIPSEWVAATTLAGGGIAWLIAGEGSPPWSSSWLWVVVSITAGLLLALNQHWFGLRLLAHLIGMGALLALAAEASTDGQRFLALAAATLVAGSMMGVPSLGDRTTPWQQMEIQLAMTVAPWTTAVLVGALEIDTDALAGTTSFLVAIAAGAAAVAVRPRVQHPHFVSLVVGASIALSIGVALGLSTTATFVALATQAAGLVVLSRALGGNVRTLVNAAILALITGAYAVGNMIDAWTIDAPIGDDAAHLAIVAALAAGSWLTAHVEIRRFAALAALAALLLWLGSVLVHLPQGQAIVSVSWAVVGTAVLVGGAVGRAPTVARTGLAVIGLTVAKLLTVDLREVDTLWRAGLFFMVGVAILRLGYLLPGLARDTGPEDGNGADESGEHVAGPDHGA